MDASTGGANSHEMQRRTPRKCQTVCSAMTESGKWGTITSCDKLQQEASRGETVDVSGEEASMSTLEEGWLGRKTMN